MRQALTMVFTGFGTAQLVLLLYISSSAPAWPHVYMLTVPPRVHAASDGSEQQSCCCFGR